MNFSTILGLLVRHGLTILGGVFVSKGVIDSTDVETIAGAGAIVAGIVMSVFNKRASK